MKKNYNELQLEIKKNREELQTEMKNRHAELVKNQDIMKQEMRERFDMLDERVQRIEENVKFIAKKTWENKKSAGALISSEEKCSHDSKMFFTFRGMGLFFTRARRRS
ncbi:hypothetical protein [Niallia sp. 03190]|uniref:hypothetical protein n=1 Tax=Niallia sp. 03190 TaxID=3458061 RepID=UPI0040448020